MFERATIFSTLVLFILFGFIGIKYFDFIEAKNQQSPSSVTSLQ